VSGLPVSTPIAVFTIHEDTGRVVVTWPDGEKMPIGTREALRKGRERTDDILETFRRGVPGLVPKLAQVESALRELLAATDQLVRLLVGDDAGLRVRIEKRLAKYRDAHKREAGGIPFVEVHGHADFFPFELLPLFGPKEVPSLGNRAEAEDVLARCLGYGVAVRRVRGEQVVSAPLRAGDGGVPMQFLRYRMPGAATEGSFFDGCEGRLVVEGPWPPDKLDRASVASKLLDSLHNPRRRLDGADSLPVPIQIQHFACHCDTQFDDADDYALILGRDAGHRVTLKEIYDGVLEREREALWDEGRPLVMLNACGSTRISAKDFRSFPTWFLSNRYRAFLGAETDVPDIVAAHYAARLYEELLGGAALAEAVVRARRRLWNERGNPLGLLYVMYGDPFLTLEPKKEESSHV